MFSSEMAAENQKSGSSMRIMTWNERSVVLAPEIQTQSASECANSACITMTYFRVHCPAIKLKSSEALSTWHSCKPVLGRACTNFRSIQKTFPGPEPYSKQGLEIYQKEAHVAYNARSGSSLKSPLITTNHFLFDRSKRIKPVLPGAQNREKDKINKNLMRVSSLQLVIARTKVSAKNTCSDVLRRRATSCCQTLELIVLLF